MPGAAASSAHVCPEIAQTEGLAWQSLSVSCSVIAALRCPSSWALIRRRNGEGKDSRGGIPLATFFFFSQSFDEFIVPKV